VQDLRTRRVSLFVLAALAAVAASSHAWPWWILTAAALLWPSRRQAWILAPAAFAVGLVTTASAPALGLAAGATAWALGWWGGADAVVLLALSLRHGALGLTAGALAALAAGLAVTLVRRRSLSSILAALPGFVTRRSMEPKVPAESEMPAAAAMAFAGLVMEGVLIWQTFG